ncbi:hypothetical protein CTEN210_05373 [Chaetoceros tenuissimus]|uniref:Uncharacterized protein n=1 Tax=Chaetoceros tenuissimus TaxID=426638 RepID=A0AAD3CMV2_9STRA|nr:hypothetical protein CTEN210_05373 [Chaetoceros tenuissimus]
MSDNTYFRTGGFYSNGMINSTDGSQWIAGGGRISGAAEIQSAYRSELGGNTAAIDFLSHISLPHQQAQTPNGKGALNMCGKEKEWVRLGSDHFDLIGINSSLWNSTPFQIQKQHVLGHQDVLGRPLTLLEILNCACDVKAKQIARSAISRNARPIFHEDREHLGTIRYQDKYITANLQSTLYTSITHSNCTTYLTEKIFEVPTLPFRKSIHWAIFSRARKTSTYAVRKFVTKWICGSMATGRVMFERQIRSHSRCPHCQEEDEHLIHIITCQNATVTALKSASLSKLSTFLSGSNTDPSFQEFLCNGLQSFLEDPYGLEPTFDSPTMYHTVAFQSVQRFGWFSLLCGFVPKDILFVQKMHFRRQHSRRSEMAWGTKLISHLWTILYELLDSPK